MAYTKKIAKHDKITIDGTDVSNSFRTFGFSSEHTQEDVSGFSVSGIDEFLPGRTTQWFTGEAFYTEELAALVYPLHYAPHDHRDHLAARRLGRRDPRGVPRQLHDQHVRPGRHPRHRLGDAVHGDAGRRGRNHRRPTSPNGEETQESPLSGFEIDGERYDLRGSTRSLSTRSGFSTSTPTPCSRTSGRHIPSWSDEESARLRAGADAQDPQPRLQTGARAHRLSPAASRGRRLGHPDRDRRS